MPYGLATAGDVLNAANVNLLPRGLLVSTSTSTITNSGVSSVLGDVGPTATFTAVAGRNYRVTFHVSRASCTVASTCVVLAANAANDGQADQTHRRAHVQAHEPQAHDC